MVIHYGKFISLVAKQRLGSTSRTFYSTLPTSSIDGEKLLSLVYEKHSKPQSEIINFAPVTASEAQHHSIMIQTPNQPEHAKVLKVSVLGMPNAGKSTFINSIFGRKLMATSDKIDTTVTNRYAISTMGDTQILIQDTPGIVAGGKAKRLGLPVRRVSQPAQSFSNADIGIVVADLTSRRVKTGYLQPEILMTMLKNMDIPTILVLNKSDKYKKKLQLPILIHQLTAGQVAGVPYEPEKISIAPMRLPKVTETIPANFDEVDLKDVQDLDRRLRKNEASLMNKLRHYRGWPHFQDVFVVSAKEQTGLDILRRYMLHHAKPGPWKFHDQATTDASPKEIILDSIRAGLLQHLPEEVPYQVHPVIRERSDREDGMLQIEIDVICRKKSHYSCVFRKSNVIAKETQEHLQDVFFLEVFVDVNPVYIRNFRP